MIWLWLHENRWTEVRSISDARKFARSLSLKSESEWVSYYRGNRTDLPPKPDDIPTRPQRVYRDKGWKGMRDWLGNPAYHKRQKQRKHE